MEYLGALTNTQAGVTIDKDTEVAFEADNTVYHYHYRSLSLSFARLSDLYFFFLFLFGCHIGGVFWLLETITAARSCICLQLCSFVSYSGSNVTTYQPTYIQIAKLSLSLSLAHHVHASLDLHRRHLAPNLQFKPPSVSHRQKKQSVRHASISKCQPRISLHSALVTTPAISSTASAF